MQIKVINKVTIDHLRRNLTDTLQPYATTSNTAITVGRARYTANNVEFTVTVSLKDADGSARTPEVTAFIDLCELYGFKPADLNREFKDNRGNTYKIIGLCPRRSKYPVLCEKNGKRLLFPAEALNRLLKQNK